MKPKYWFILGGMLSFAIVAAAFILAYPPFETVVAYDPVYEYKRIWRVNNWWGTCELVRPAYFKDKEEAAAAADPGIFSETKDSQPGIDLSGMTDPFTGETVKVPDTGQPDQSSQDTVLEEGYVPDLEDQSSGGR